MTNSLGVKATAISRRNTKGEKEWGVFYVAAKRTVWCKTWAEVSKRLDKANAREKVSV